MVHVKVCVFPLFSFSFSLFLFLSFVRIHSIRVCVSACAVTGVCLSALNWREQRSDGGGGVMEGALRFCLAVFKTTYKRNSHGPPSSSLVILLSRSASNALSCGSFKQANKQRITQAIHLSLHLLWSCYLEVGCFIFPLSLNFFT